MNSRVRLGMNSEVKLGMNSEVKLGDEVVDKVSGFSGVTVAEHRYFNGCKRFSVQPYINDNGKLPECETFDVLQLKIVEKDKAVCEPVKNRTGGCSKYEDKGR